MSDDEVAYTGYAKLRLIHARGRSLLMPDHVVIQETGTYWLQPQWFYPSMLMLDEPGYSSLHIAIANRLSRDVIIRVEIRGDDLVASLPDRSHVYRCTVYGPQNLALYKAGRCRVRPDTGIDLRLYHHTAKATKPLIVASSHIKDSAWNFQGTKRLANCQYAYFTSLDRIVTEEDLQRIAMSGAGRLLLRLDQSPSWAAPDLVLEVYREQTENRAGRLGLWVPAEDVSPSHIFEHHTGVIEYEVAHPWIYRVGLEPHATYDFVGDRATSDQNGLNRFDYIVIGDCTTEAGLAAPYDEEITGETFEIENLGTSTVFEFWRDHSNQPLWRGDLDTQEFSP